MLEVPEVVLDEVAPAPDAALVIAPDMLEVAVF